MRPYRHPTKAGRAAECLRVNHADAPSLPAAYLPHSSGDPATLLLTTASLESQDSEPWLVSLIGTYTSTLYGTLPLVSDCLGMYTHWIARCERVLSCRKFSVQAHRYFMG